MQNTYIFTHVVELFMKLSDFSMILRQIWISMIFQELWEPWNNDDKKFYKVMLLLGSFEIHCDA